MAASEEKIKDLKEQLNQIQTQIEHEQTSSTSKEVKDLYSWISPSRVFRRRDRQWFTNVAILVLLLIVILLFIREFIAISVVLAVAFVYYVLATVPPDNIEHKITTQGVKSANHVYLWSELTEFWFSTKHGQQIIHIDTKLRYPKRLIMLLGEGDKDKVKDIIANYLPYREVAKGSWLDSMSDFLTSRLPASMR